MIDQTWAGLSHVRKLGLNGLYWDVLSEQIDYYLDLTPYRFMLAMTKNDMYNAHVCEDFAPDLGREHLYQTAFHAEEMKFIDTSFRRTIAFHSSCFHL